MKVGFGVESLLSLCPTGLRLVDDVDVRAMYLEQDRQRLVVIVADLTLIWSSTCAALKQAVAGGLNIPEDRVVVVATQNHGLHLDGTAYDRDEWRRVCLVAAQRAAAAAEPAQVGFLSQRPPRQLNLCRRISIPGLGDLSFYYGYRVQPDGSVDATHLVREAVAALRRGDPRQVRVVELPDDDSLPANQWPAFPPEPWRPRAASDELLQAVLFRRADGAPLGSIVRFAAHPVAANRRGADWVSGDYPCYVRRSMTERFGGTGLFLPRPCGDQAPLVGSKSILAARRIGAAIADAVTDRLAEVTWDPAPMLRAHHVKVKLPLRADLPDAGPASAELSRLEEDLAADARRGADLWTLKRRTDRIETLSNYLDGRYMEWTGVDPAAQREVAHEIPAFALGRITFVGLPAEPFGDFSGALRTLTHGESLVVFEGANGYLSYLPTTADWERTGYGPNAAMLGAAAGGALVQAGVEAIRGLPP